MSTVGQIEKPTQARVVKLFRDRLGYDYLGNSIDREGNSNIEPELLGVFLKRQGHEDAPDRQGSFGYDREDVAGLLKNRLEKARERFRR